MFYNLLHTTNFDSATLMWQPFFVAPFLSGIYRLTMPKNETLAEQLFGSFGDDDWDDTQSTQETSHLIVNSPRSTDSEPTRSDR